MQTNLSNDRLQWLDGLRGIAILLVVGVHFSIKQRYGVELGMSNTGYSSFLSDVLDIGAFGVQLFYMISGFTMCYMWNIYPKENKIRNFFIRRFFRLSPMFYLMIIIPAITHYLVRGEFDLTRFILSLLFITDFTTYGSYAPGGGTIDMEFTFYLIFPFIVVFMNKLYMPALWIVITLMWAYFNSKYNIFDKYEFILYQGMFFVTGGYLYHLYKQQTFKNIFSNYYILPIWIIVTLIVLNYHDSFIVFEPRNSVIILFTFAILILSAMYSTSTILTNKAMVFFGTISFSLYLLHFVILSASSSIIKTYGGMGFGFAGYLYLLGLSSLVLYLSYKYIEKNGINMGKKIIKGLK
ncbi:MAG: acyltransferase family protein [Alphaproteobacteria bacterium]